MTPHICHICQSSHVWHTPPPKLGKSDTKKIGRIGSEVGLWTFDAYLHNDGDKHVVCTCPYTVHVWTGSTINSIVYISGMWSHFVSQICSLSRGLTSKQQTWTCRNERGSIQVRRYAVIFSGLPCPRREWCNFNTTHNHPSWGVFRHVLPLCHHGCRLWDVFPIIYCIGTCDFEILKISSCAALNPGPLGFNPGVLPLCHRGCRLWDVFPIIYCIVERNSINSKFGSVGSNPTSVSQLCTLPWGSGF